GHSLLQEEILSSLQIIGIDQIHTSINKLAPEKWEIRRAPKPEAPTLLVCFLNYLLELGLLFGGDWSGPLPMKAARPIAANPGDQRGWSAGIQILQLSIISSVTNGFARKHI